MPATIFISHSAKDQPAAEFLDVLEEGLRDAGFDVWLDRARLQGGDDWRVVIANALAECHGAVALFSTAALDSEYFKFEVGNLFARWTREQADPNLSANRRLRFCPVVAPPLTVDEVKQAPFVAATYFGVVNWLVPADAADALRRVKEVVTGLGEWPSPIEDVTALAEAILVDVNAAAVYEAAARDAGFSPADLGPPANHPARLTRLLCRCSIDSLCRALLRVRGVLGTEKTRTLFELLAPGWVSFEAAHRFNEYLDAGTVPPDRFAVIAGAFPQFTPQMYVQRARRNTRDAAGYVVTVPGPEGGTLAGTALLGQVDTALVKFLKQRYANTRWDDVAKDVADLEAAHNQGNRAEAAPRLGRLIKRLVIAGRPVVVVIPASEVDFDLVAALPTAAGLERVTFVALSSFDQPRPPHDARYILPELNSDLEAFAYDACVGFDE
jgi:hypothetical protein